jgi:hypothetical protein
MPFSANASRHRSASKIMSAIPLRTCYALLGLPKQLHKNIGSDISCLR